jgi:hypothetical protein
MPSDSYQQPPWPFRLPFLAFFLKGFVPRCGPLHLLDIVTSDIMTRLFWARLDDHPQ